MTAWDLALDMDVGGYPEGKGSETPSAQSALGLHMQRCGAMSLTGLSHLLVGQVPKHHDRVL